MNFGLRQATIHEQNVFAKALEEMLSPIENPKYILIRKRKDGYQYWHSYTCPSVLSAKKEDAELLQQNMGHLCGNFALVYTYNAEGRERLWRSCCRSYVNLNEDIRRKLLVTPEQSGS